MKTDELFRAAHAGILDRRPGTSRVHDSMHDSDPGGWAEHVGQLGVVRLLRGAQA